MFRTLHKLSILLFYGCLVLGGYIAYLWLYPPVSDLVAALRVTEGFAQRVQGSITGQVVQVFDGDTFRLRDDRGTLFTLTLTGLQAPDPHRASGQSVRARALASKTNLMNFILSNRLRFEVTYSNRPRACIGLAYCGNTNVNVAMVAGGSADAQKAFMKGLPLHIRYNLLRADRISRNRP